MTDAEYQNLLAPALSMNERESAGHYYNLAEQWYHLQNNKAFKAFSKHLLRITKLLQSTDKNTRLDSVRALAFIAACPRLHRQLFEYDVLKQIVYILGSSPEAANCEAALVVLNHLCTQSSRDQRSKFSLVTDFCKDKQSLIIIFRYAHVEDRCLSIIANVMSVLAALCTERPNIQEHCIRAGIMERAFNLKTSHRDRIVRTNVDLFLNAMLLQPYPVDKFNEMHTLMCLNMGYSSRALCLAIWRLIQCGRGPHALKAKPLYTAVHRISEDDPTLEDDWYIVARFVSHEKQNEANGVHPHHNGARPIKKEDNPDTEQHINNKLPQLHASKSWLEKDLHIAILQTNPIESDEGGNLALNAERKRLQDILFRTTRGLKIFFGVLTRDSLIRCIQRGAQIVHISGHGPYEKKLKVENKFGRLEDLSAVKIKEAIEKGSSSKTSRNVGLKLVFVSTCYSEHVAQSFCDAGVPHVVAVHSMVQILDQMATKFASAFYEALIAHKASVEEAFTNSKAELLLESDVDCCCRHEGHIPDCRCPICKIYRCCSHHHGVSSQCAQKIKIECCQPRVPHKHSDKFLLLPRDADHDEEILSYLPNARCERIDSRPPTNIGQPSQKIVGRARDTSILVDFLHPDNENGHDAVVIYGRPKIGLTTVALQVGRFFTRPWYQPMFLGGVFRINLQNCDDPNALYSYIAQAMNLHVFGSYSYWDSNGYTLYDDATQKELHAALSGDDIIDPIQTFRGADDPEHFIILDQHKNHKDLLKHMLPKLIYSEFEKRKAMLPMEFYIDPHDDTKVRVRRIKFTPPDEEGILEDIKRYGVEENENKNHFEFQKLLIIDHINFPTPKIKQFLQKIKRLIENVKCKLLLVCHDRIQRIIHKIQQRGGDLLLKQRLWRIKPITKKDASKLLLEQSRQLYEFDFSDMKTPTTADETSQFALFEWLSKTPVLIQQCSMVLDRKVPFCVICKMMQQSPDKWCNALNIWAGPLKLQPDELKDALMVLTTLLTEINVAKSIWSDVIQPAAAAAADAVPNNQLQ
eukprot:59542_1